ncbi:PTS sugar transporter subunit IIA [bacterium]|nr:PTS sugar transporter subunit IIA [bacterium]
MRLSEMLREDTIVVGFKSSLKQDILEELIDIAEKTGKIKDRNEALKAVIAREEMMSTGLEHGIAIPHAKTNAVSEIVMAMGIAKEGVDFDAVDGNQSYIFFFLLAPENAAAANVKLLAQIARITSSADFRNKIIKAESPAQILEILISEE